MKRVFIEKLDEWSKKSNRKPLVLSGVRQVGKTWLLKEFGHPMELPVWQKVRGLDLHSLVIRAIGSSARIAFHELSAKFTLPLEAEDFRAPAVVGPRTDYLGDPYPSEGTMVRPGPFQTFRCAGKDGYMQALVPQLLTAAPGYLR